LQTAYGVGVTLVEHDPDGGHRSSDPGAADRRRTARANRDRRAERRGRPGSAESPVGPRPLPAPDTVFQSRASAITVAGTSDLDGRLEPGRRVVLASIGPGDHLGAMGVSAARVLEDAARRARNARLPLVLVLSSSGADIGEGIAALHGWGRVARAVAACSGVVPVLTVVDGPAVSGQALVLGLSDLVVMTDGSYAFVSGPSMVREVTGVAVDNASLGDAGVHARETGVATLVAPDLDGALDAVADLLAYLPDNVDTLAPRIPSGDDPDRFCDELGSIIPDSSTGSYDVRRVITGIADDGDLLEVKARWSPQLVTAFTRIDGHSVGVVANQPVSLAGTLDIKAAQKGAWFVALCDAFNVPILTLVDTPGYFPGKDLEWRGMIRHGAQMAFAYAEASVPRICIVLRKAYGGAYIVLDSKTMGNDLCVAWPTAELAVMGAKGAVQILMRRGTDAERAAAEVDYQDRYLNPYIAAERGLIDGVIEPGETRRLVSRALALLADKRERLSPRTHGNSPL
jgi:acetyl-CoA carboxylase carboxyltransferase component